MLNEKPIIDVLTNKVTGFNTEGFVLKITKEYVLVLEARRRWLMDRAAKSLNIKGRLVETKEKKSMEQKETIGVQPMEMEITPSQKV